MAPVLNNSMAWLIDELYSECLKSGNYSIVKEYLPILDDTEQYELSNHLFWKALIGRKWWLAEICLSNGVCLVPRETYDCGPLHNAMSFCGDSPDIIEWLLAHGAEINRRDWSQANSTPLIHATASCLNETVDLLLRHGANPNESTIIDNDDTALLMAIKTNNVKAIKLLLEYGADSTIKNRWNQDAATLAKQKGLSILEGKR